MSTPAAHVRPLRRADIARLAELRLWYLAETARLEPRLKLVPEARERLTAAVTSWWGEEGRTTLVVEDPLALVPAGEDVPIVGYITGRVSVWPPVWKAQRVGEIVEAFVAPDRRNRGLGRALVAHLVDALVPQGVDVLRSKAPVKNDGSVGLLTASGFTPLFHLLEKPAHADRAGGRR